MSVFSTGFSLKKSRVGFDYSNGGVDYLPASYSETGFTFGQVGCTLNPIDYINYRDKSL